MKVLFNSYIRPLIRKFGVDVVRYSENSSEVIQGPSNNFPPDFDEVGVRICSSVRDYTMTSPERVYALLESVKYVVRNSLDGAFVECGVWRGGSSMAMALMLIELGEKNREVYLYDTFSGMSLPSDADVSYSGELAQEEYRKLKMPDGSSDWCLSPIEEVMANVTATGYPTDKLHFVKGRVEDTIPEHLPNRIALLRLDTDWYESTRHELRHLFPLITPGGVLIVDDYGHWQGAKKATDEYIAENNLRILLSRIDYTGRLGIKP